MSAINSMADDLRRDPKRRPRPPKSWCWLSVADQCPLLADSGHHRSTDGTKLSLLQAPHVSFEKHVRIRDHVADALLVARRDDRDPSGHPAHEHGVDLDQAEQRSD